MLLGINAYLRLKVFGGDATNAYAYSLAPSQSYLAIDDAYADWYKESTGRDVNS